MREKKSARSGRRRLFTACLPACWPASLRPGRLGRKEAHKRVGSSAIKARREERPRRGSLEWRGSRVEERSDAARTTRPLRAPARLAAHHPGFWPRIWETGREGLQIDAQRRVPSNRFQGTLSPRIDPLPPGYLALRNHCFLRSACSSVDYRGGRHCETAKAISPKYPKQSKTRARSGQAQPHGLAPGRSSPPSPATAISRLQPLLPQQLRSRWVRALTAPAQPAVRSWLVTDSVAAAGPAFAARSTPLLPCRSLYLSVAPSLVLPTTPS